MTDKQDEPGQMTLSKTTPDGTAEGGRTQTWRGALADLCRSATRHKILSGVIALCVAGSLAAIVAASSPGTQGPAAVSDPIAPAFSLPVLGRSGQDISLAEYAGKPLIVNFFASWCTPCQQETPLLARFYRSEHGRIALVGLDENDVASHAESFTRAKGVSYPVAFDPETIAASAYSVAALPQTFFLNAEHRIVDRFYGALTQADINKGIALVTRS